MTTNISPTPSSQASRAATGLAGVSPSNAAKASTTVEDPQVVTCVTGGYRFALPTDNLAGVYQVTRQQMGKDMDVLETPEGKMPVASLSTLLSLHLGLDLKPSNEERALIAIRSGNQIATLRVGQVSRPIDVPTKHWHRLPLVANPKDSNNLFSHIINVDPQSKDPNVALTLAIDPLKALQFESDSPERAPQPAAAPANHPLDLESALPARRGAGQLLAFAPEDVTRQNLSFVFCLPLAAVAEVVTAHDTLHSPLGNDKFSGYILWRNIPVPVVRLGSAFGLTSIENDKRNRLRERRLVIARTSGHRYIGFYTQTQMHSMKAPTSNPISLEQLAGTPHMGAFKTEVGAMVLPDLQKILDS